MLARLPFTVLPILGAALLASCANRRETFDTADVNDDRQLTLEELSDAVTRDVYYETDTNNDELVSFEEWKVIAPNLDREDFRTRDADGDGMIDLDEALAYTRSNKIFDPLFEGLDDDGDQVVDPEEARDYLQEKQALMESRK